MAQELEIKLKIDSHDSLRRRLEEVHAQRTGAELETNRLFDRADLALRIAGSGLRIRESVDPHSHAAQSVKLTFKGPVEPGAFKRREEIEFEIADAAAGRTLLNRLGFLETLVFEKRREEWRVGACTVALDEVPHLGTFVEIEGPDEAAITAALAQLELCEEAQESRSYVEMLADFAAMRGLNPLAIRFSGVV